MTDPIIDVQGLSKSYHGKRGIAGVSFEVREGEVFGFLGPNGAGKTTTIRVLMALLRADSGSARLAGMDCWQESVAIKRIVGYLPGELSLDPNLTGGQILAYLGNLRGGVDTAYVTSLVERLDLDTSRKFRQYSSGNKRKVGLIQAFMHRPRLVVLDEPTNGLDPLGQQEFDRIVTEVRDEGRTVFVSSHILSEVERICSRVGIIREGRMVRIGVVAEMKDIKRYEVTIIFGEPAATERFQHLAGVEHAEAIAGGNGLRITIQGSVDAVIKEAARYRVISLTSHEPSLEDIFLRYYQSDGEAQKEAAGVV